MLKLDHSATVRLMTALFIFCLLTSGDAGGVFAQTASSTDSDYGVMGVELYRKGEFREAIRFLQAAVKKNEYRNNAETWNYLGLAIYKTNDLKEARKAFEKATKLNPGFEGAHLNLAFLWLQQGDLRKAVGEAERVLKINAQSAPAHYLIGVTKLGEGAAAAALEKAKTALSCDPAYAAAWLLKNQATVRLWADKRGYKSSAAKGKNAKEPVPPTPPAPENLELLQQAVADLDQYLKLTPAQNENSHWREMAEGLHSYLEMKDKSNPQRNVFSISEEGVTRPVVLYKEKAKYTEEARSAKVQGDVAILMLIRTDGKVRPIVVLKPLSRGLTEEALKAAVKMRFQPATKDGRPVPVTIVVEFSFNIY